MSSRPSGNPGFIEFIFTKSGTPTIIKHVAEHMSENTFEISSLRKSTLRGLPIPVSYTNLTLPTILLV